MDSKNTDTTGIAGRLSVKIAVIVFMVLFIFFLLEIGCRIIEKEDRLSKILKILKQNSTLFWKQKSGLNTSFFGGKTRTGREGLRVTGETRRTTSADYRILVLGASPSFGWGVDDNETYAALLEEKLNTTYNKPFDVINGSGIGYSSFQGLTFLKENIEKINPDLITVSYVINDVDNYRFFQNTGTEDKEVELLPGPVVMLKNILSNSAFCRIYEKLIASLKANRKGKEINYAVFPGSNRVSIQDYENNLIEFINLAGKYNKKIVFIKFPVNLVLGPAIIDEIKAQAFFESGVNQYRLGKIPEAMQDFKKALELNPIHSKAYYYLGKCALDANDAVAASEYFRQVKICESYNCAHDSIKYNAVMEKIAGEYAVPLVDIVAAFQSSNKGYLFLNPDEDTIHPNRTGHEIIAHELYLKLKSIIED